MKPNFSCYLDGFMNLILITWTVEVLVGIVS